jgi:two-component system, response regulator PdtaR
MTKLLIVEDDPMLGQDLKSVLLRLGYEVVGIAKSAEEAMSEAGKRCPDLAVMDVNIEGKLDGIQTAHLLNSVYRVPVLFLTSANDEGTVRRAVKEFSYAYLLKPFKQHLLDQTIKSSLMRSQLDAARGSARPRR